MASAACDQGSPNDENTQGPPIHLVAANYNVAANQPIQLAFDRFLLPLSTKRQAFFLQDLDGTPLTPAIDYDPVSRVVTLTPGSALTEGHTLQLTILAPAGRSDANGLRAIDGAGFDPTVKQPILFSVKAAGTALSTPTIDLCATILPLFQNSCAGSNCHSGTLPASGLALTSVDGLRQTAFGKSARGANTGPLSGPGTEGQVTPIFGIDMPILDNNGGPTTGGDPGDSWLLYKLLMAAQPSGAPAPNTSAYAISWSLASESERERLYNLIPGREMPFPSNPSASTNANALTGDQLEQVSLWIAQGATLPSSCP